MALAWKRAGTCWGGEGSSVKPTPRCALKCEEGEWPHTGEFQPHVQWWRQVFAYANCGHLQLRFFVELVALVN